MKRPLTKREKILLGLALGGVSLYIGMQGLLLPLTNGLQQSETEIAQRRLQYASMLKVVHEAGHLEQNQTEQAQDGSQSALTAQFLREIQAAAGRVAIHRFQPVRATLNNRTATARERKRKRFTLLEVKIECFGQLPDLMTFFQRLETGDRLTRIRHLYLAPEGGRKDGLQCQFVIVRMFAS
ncbi:MAG: hypothetical protein ACE5IY_11200 [bacterium]